MSPTSGAGLRLRSFIGKGRRQRPYTGLFKVASRAHLPRQTRDLRESIDAWWRRRAIPPTRDGIRGILDSMGIRSAVELLNRSHGLSLSDQYWVKPESSDLEWDTVNFFTNPFDEELGRTLLTARSSSHRFSLNAPDASTGGDLPKRWTIAGDGTRILIKAGRTGQEPVNELIASDLCSRLGIPAVRYNLGEYDNRPVSTCPEMLTDTRGTRIRMADSRIGEEG